MRAPIWLPLLACCLSASATLPATERTLFLPACVYGVYQDDGIGAINVAVWVLASPANTRGNAVEAAKAIVALEYLSGELPNDPRWIGMDWLITLHMAQARDELRRVPGIHPDTPPHVVVNTRLALSRDLQTGDLPAATQLLASPVFISPPEQTFRTLPDARQANLATARAQEASFSGRWSTILILSRPPHSA
jgi:hypothetical protein